MEQNIKIDLKEWAKRNSISEEEYKKLEKIFIQNNRIGNRDDHDGRITT